VNRSDQAIEAVGGTNAFSIAMLQLCAISYDPSGIWKAVQNLKPLTPGGAWFCVWGPKWNRIDSNLAFVAAYYAQNATSPMFTCVVIRGTDLDIWDPLGIIYQLYEDLDPGNPVSVPWPSKFPNATIAGGSYDGAHEIITLTIVDPLYRWLKLFLAEPGNNTTTLVVTGHSLGGCLTTVVAPWLQDLISPAPPAPPVPIVPVTFAAPTAGNQPFANDFNARFQNALLYQNPHDVAPSAYGNLPGVPAIYQPVFGIPELVNLALDFVEYEIEGLTYVQPSPGPPLRENALTSTSWLDEAWHQHHPATYMSLLGGTNVGRIEKMTSRRGRRPPVRHILG
jgi:triacylglycerol lipase